MEKITFTETPEPKVVEYTDMRCGLVKIILNEYFINHLFENIPDDSSIIQSKMQNELDTLLNFDTSVDASISSNGIDGQITVYDELGGAKIIDFVIRHNSF